MSSIGRLIVSELQSNATLAALLRYMDMGRSWSQARRLVESRRVCVNGEMVMDSARRLKTGDVVEIHDQPRRLPAAFVQELVIRHLDAHIVVVEKPAGISTVRHPLEREWDEQRRQRVPTLEDRLHKAISARLGLPPRSPFRLRKVHRLDKLTSGLVVFARSAEAERMLGRQFFKHTVIRKYLAVVVGQVEMQTIRSWLIRDRGDGRRGSSSVEGQGKFAVTHVEPIQAFPGHTLVACRLETGRTHQIRIHLSELGHPVCGDPVYGDRSTVTTAPRLALHAAELGFDHPITGATMHWDMPLPNDFEEFVAGLRSAARRG